ncbi:MAG: TonB-dependent receptor, partial [Alphaproteobacteria bacterium]
MIKALRVSGFAMALALLPMSLSAQEGDLAEADLQAEATAPEPAPTPKGPRLDEIVVTAQKRAEDVRDVPIAMSVMSGQEMRDSGITDFNEVAQMIPNVSINTDFYAMYIRGIGTAEANVLAEQAIGFIIDGVYLARIEFLRPGFIDVERVEVLRGPQGTLFGRNSPAGVINMTSGTPDPVDYGMRLELTGGERGKFDGRVMLTGPLWQDVVAGRMNAGWVESEGHTENLHNDVGLGDRRTIFGRGTLAGDVTENIDARLTVTWYDYSVGQMVGTEQSFTPDELVTLFRTQDPNFEGKMDRRGTTRYGAGSNGEGMFGGLEVNWDIGEYTLTSVTGFAGYDDVTGGDLDATAFPVIDGFYEQVYEQTTQEFRLTSPPGYIDFVAGLFYMNSTTEADLDIVLLQDLTIDGVTANLLPNVLGSALSPVLDLLPLNTLFEGDHLLGSYGIEINSYAAFLQANWHITDDLTAIFGGRYTSEDKDFRAKLGPQIPASLWAVYLGGLGYDETRERSETNFSPKVSLSWEAMEEITLYATWAEGFRAGSFNITALTADDLQFETESSTTFDVGIKTEFWDQRARVNLSLFRTDYENLQLSTFQTVTFVNSNAEEVMVQGMEFDVTLLPFEGALFNLAAGYTDGEYVKHTKGGCHGSGLLDLEGGLEGPGVVPPNNICDLSGRQLHRAPRWTGSSTIGMGIPLGNLPFAAAVAFTASYKGFEYLDSDLDPIDSQDAYWLFNARMGLRDLEERWSFTVHVKN